MDPAVDPPAYEPKKLDALDLRAAITPGQRLLPVAALFGVVIAFLRPSAGLAGWLLMGTGALTLGLTGSFSIGFGSALALFAYFLCGMFVGIGQDLRRWDGE